MHQYLCCCIFDCTFFIFYVELYFNLLDENSISFCAVNSHSVVVKFWGWGWGGSVSCKYFFNSFAHFSFGNLLFLNHFLNRFRFLNRFSFLLNYFFLCFLNWWFFDFHLNSWFNFSWLFNLNRLFNFNSLFY